MKRPGTAGSRSRVLDRRILRIWPLYYLIVFIGFFVLPLLEPSFQLTGYLQTILRHICIPFMGFLGNWSMVLVAPIGHDWLSVLWSVCVEEQFYLIVPLLIVWCLPGRRCLLVVCSHDRHRSRCGSRAPSIPTRSS